MKKHPLLAALPFFVLPAAALLGQSVTVPDASPRAGISQTIGITTVSVE